MTRLIVNADDFGLTEGVNRSVLELRQAGALTSATLMAVAAETDAAAAATVGLGVGCHVVLVDGTPALPAEQVPALAPGGRFRPTLGMFVRDLFLGRIPEAEMEAEAIAQMRRLQTMGVKLTHADSHKHTHMFPGVLRPLIMAAMQCGVRAVRNPFEPDWALAATPGAPLVRRMQVKLLRTMRRQWIRLTREAGMATTDGAIGVLATGTLDAKTVASLLRGMPKGTWELVCHPGYVDAALHGVRTRLRESRAVEHEALKQTVPEFLAGRPDVQAAHFGDLV